jgi:hypothetical protein
MRVPIGREEVQSWYFMCNSLLLLVCTSGADGMENVVGVAEQFSSLPVMRYLRRLHSRDIPGADIGQCGIVGIPVRLCLAGRKRSRMANLVER